jgi:hypothetical protein
MLDVRGNDNYILFIVRGITQKRDILSMSATLG